MLQVSNELRVLEEVLLLVLDADSGDIRNAFPLRSRAVAFAGRGADGPRAGAPH